MKLQLRDARTSIASGLPVSLSQIEDTGYGIQAQPGITGMGLPPREPSFSASGRSGAVLRSQRGGQREVTIPLAITGLTQEDIRDRLGDLAGILAGPVNLYVTCRDGSTWILAECAAVGQPDYTTGVDYRLGSRVLRTEISLRSSFDYFQAVSAQTDTITTGGVSAISWTPLLGGDLPSPPNISVSLNAGQAFQVGQPGQQLYIRYTATTTGWHWFYCAEGRILEPGGQGYLGLDAASCFGPMQPATHASLPVVFSVSSGTLPATISVSYTPRRGALL